MLTFLDLLDHAQAYSGKDATEGASADYRRGVLAAYRNLPQLHNWNYYYGITRIATNASYGTGTIEYDHTGGATERRLTLTDGVWPSWAASGFLRISDVPYEVQARVSDTVLTLSSTSNPGDDIAAGTAYELLRDSYTLPDGFLTGDEMVSNDRGTVLHFVHPRDWSSSRRLNAGPGNPQQYTYVGDPRNPGQKLVKFWPAPDARYSLDLLYKRAARRLVIDRRDAGFVSAAAAGVTVTGTDTAFTSSMIGSVIRFGDDSITPPTGLYGNTPFAYERFITEVASPTSLTVDAEIPEELTAVKYVVSDPADIDEDVHSVLLYREIERQMRPINRSKEMDYDSREYRTALMQAQENNSVHTGRRASMRYQTRPSGLKYHPSGPDVA